MTTFCHGPKLARSARIAINLKQTQHEIRYFGTRLGQNKLPTTDKTRRLAQQVTQPPPLTPTTSNASLSYEKLHMQVRAAVSIALLSVQ